jgi:hypothetical protein
MPRENQNASDNPTIKVSVAKKVAGSKGMIRISKKSETVPHIDASGALVSHPS